MSNDSFALTEPEPHRAVADCDLTDACSRARADDVFEPDPATEAKRWFDSEEEPPDPAVAFGLPGLPRSAAVGDAPFLPGAATLLAYPPKGQGPGQKRAGRFLSEDDLSLVLRRIDVLSRNRESDRAKVLLSFRAGLRPCEIAGLRRRTLLGARGEIKDILEVMGATAKRGKPRLIPMHPQLREALRDLVEAFPEAEFVAFKRRADGTFDYQCANKVSYWFSALFYAADLDGTGMSGRCTFATMLEQVAPASLVQQVLGHANLQMTGRYLRPVGDVTDAIHRLGSAE